MSLNPLQVSYLFSAEVVILTCFSYCLVLTCKVNQQFHVWKGKKMLFTKMVV